jgi:hypothetical protein
VEGGLAQIDTNGLNLSGDDSPSGVLQPQSLFWLAHQARTISLSSLDSLTLKMMISIAFSG